MLWGRAKRHMRTILIIAATLAVATPAFASVSNKVPSITGVDAPELAAMGSCGVGYKKIILIHRNQPKLDSADPKTGAAPLYDRQLVVDLWYPALTKRGAKPVSYRAAFWGEPPKPPVTFTVPGLAILGAPARGNRRPLVIVSHGYSNVPAAMTWLTENLASKGYVVAGIRHEDPNPYISSAAVRNAPHFYRPLDISFVAAQLKSALGAQIDPERTALIGYSQGGYGILTAGGATLDPEGPAMDQVAGGWLKHYARGGPKADEIGVSGLKAIVALAPAGGIGKSAWGAAGLAAIRAPLLLIHGDADPVVDYKSGGLAVFAGAVNADRYLLTYKQAGHAIALSPAPSEMRSSLWDLDWFEDPIWRQDRINAINLHFVTAFLGLHLRDDARMRSFLDVPIVESDQGEWSAPQGTPWGAYSPGGEGITLWKGFQRRHARGMEMRHLPKSN
jgi:alpha-beta hydrolase superfamily lysophospholipase